MSSLLPFAMSQRTEPSDGLMSERHSLFAGDIHLPPIIHFSGSTPNGLSVIVHSQFYYAKCVEFMLTFGDGTQNVFRFRFVFVVLIMSIQ